MLENSLVGRCFKSVPDFDGDYFYFEVLSMTDDPVAEAKCLCFPVKPKFIKNGAKLEEGYEIDIDIYYLNLQRLQEISLEELGEALLSYMDEFANLDI